MSMWLKRLFLTIFFIIFVTDTKADFPPTQIYDEGIKQGVFFNLDCTGAGINCTQSGITGTITVSGNAPTDADYLVGTANGTLSAEIVVGTVPGGELGNTWASPTIDTTHSGSAHHTSFLSTDIDTSAEIAAIVTDETGTNLLTFNNAPTIHAPYIRGAGTGITFALRVADTTPTDRLVVLDNGSVGIGTTAPNSKLDISGSGVGILFSGAGGPRLIRFNDDNDVAGVQLVYRTAPNQLILEAVSDGSDGTDIFYLDKDDSSAYFVGNVGIGTTAPIATLDIRATTAPLFVLRVANSTPTDILTVTQGGNVGIGTTAPGSKLMIIASNTAPANNLAIKGTAGARLIISQPDGGCSSCGVDNAGTTWSCIDVTCP